MRYYKAEPVNNKPFIYWHLWANSIEELQALGYEDDPLIIAEADMPDYQFGVCPMKIVDGQLVNRTAQEMEDFESEFIASSGFRTYGAKIADVNKALFVYDGKSFPMHDAARLFYGCIQRTAANYKVQHSTGIVDVFQADIPAFLDAYYNKLQTLTQPE
jgi:hypothetical protein